MPDTSTPQLFRDVMPRTSIYFRLRYFTSSSLLSMKIFHAVVSPQADLPAVRSQAGSPNAFDSAPGWHKRPFRRAERPPRSIQMLTGAEIWIGQGGLAARINGLFVPPCSEPGTTHQGGQPERCCHYTSQIHAVSTRRITRGSASSRSKLRLCVAQGAREASTAPPTLSKLGNQSKTCFEKALSEARKKK